MRLNLSKSLCSPGEVMTFYEHFWSKPSARPSCNECWIQKIQQQIMVGSMLAAHALPSLRIVRCLVSKAM